MDLTLTVIGYRGRRPDPRPAWLAWGLLTGEDLDTAVALGAACGALAQSTRGDAFLGKDRELLALLAQVREENAHLVIVGHVQPMGEVAPGDGCDDL